MEAVTDERILWKVYADHSAMNSTGIMVRDAAFTSKEQTLQVRGVDWSVGTRAPPTAALEEDEPCAYRQR